MNLWRFLIAALLIAHGLIHWGLAAAPPPAPGGPNTPYWPSIWRAASSDTWPVAAIGLDNAAVRALGGVLWIAATIGFVLAGLGVLGVPGLHEWWRGLTVASVAVSLPLFILFWHPWLIVGAALDVAILVSLLWANWPATDVVGA